MCNMAWNLVAVICDTQIFHILSDLTELKCKLLEILLHNSDL